MSDKELKALEILTFECDACAESEGGSGLPCTLTSGLIPGKQELFCPVSSDQCGFHLVSHPDSPAVKESAALIDLCRDRAGEIKFMEQVHKDNDAIFAKAEKRISEQAKEIEGLKGKTNFCVQCEQKGKQIADLKAQLATSKQKGGE